MVTIVVLNIISDKLDDELITYTDF